MREHLEKEKSSPRVKPYSVDSVLSPELSEWSRENVGRRREKNQIERNGGGGKKGTFAGRFIRPVKWSLRTWQQIHTGRSACESHPRLVAKPKSTNSYCRPKPFVDKQGSIDSESADHLANFPECHLGDECLAMVGHGLMVAVVNVHQHASQLEHDIMNLREEKD